VALGLELQAARLLKHVSCSAAFTDADDVFFRWQADDPVRTRRITARLSPPFSPPHRATHVWLEHHHSPKSNRPRAAVVSCIARPFGMPSSRGKVSSAVLCLALCKLLADFHPGGWLCEPVPVGCAARGMRGGARWWNDSGHCPSASR
jgi:hypothetical protein